MWVRLGNIFQLFDFTVGFALVVVVGLWLRWWVLGTWVRLWVLSLVLDWTDGEDGVFQ